MTKEVRHDNSCRFRLYPNKQQRELIAKTFGCCRWVYNWGLAIRKKAWEEEKKSLSLTDIQSQLPAMKKDAATSWLKEVDAKALIFSLRCMDTAYQESILSNLSGRSFLERKKQKKHGNFLIIKLFRLIIWMTHLTLASICNFLSIM